MTAWRLPAFKALPDGPEFYDRANCAGADPNLFFPVKVGNPASNGAEAKRLCAGCSVRAECLQHALDTGEQIGIWGGESIEAAKGRLNRDTRPPWPKTA